MKTTSINTLPCIIFKNSSHQGEVYSWVFDAGDADGFAKGKKELEEMSWIKIVSVSHASVKGAARMGD